MRCPRCGDWSWRELSLQVGLAAVERHCPRCRTRCLLVFRGSTFVLAVQLPGLRMLEAALLEAGVSRPELALLLPRAVAL